MYDAGKISLLIIVFLAIFTFPLWYNIASGKASYVPEPVINTTEEECVESAEYMRTMHMDLLNEWRDEVVRNNNQVYISSNGKRYTMSLTNTCMKCHSSKTEFCDQCHDYIDVNPYCWDCHIEPRESQ